VPTGTLGNGINSTVLTPTIAYGKGFGNFSLQGTFGAALPTHDVSVFGRAYLWNNALQYRTPYKLWPELEFNFTGFDRGPNDGRRQLFITPGLMIGRFRLWKRLGFAVGAGFQIAATSFHTTNHNVVISTRFPF